MSLNQLDYLDFFDKPLPETWKDKLLKYTCWLGGAWIIYLIIT